MKLFKNIIDNLYFYSLDVKESMNMFESKNKRKVKVKTNILRDTIFIFAVAFIGTIIILINNYITKPFDYKSNKIKSIEIINFIQDDGGKKMLVDDREGIEKVVIALNEIRKEKGKNIDNDDIFLTDNRVNNQYMIFKICFKNKYDYFEIKDNVLIKKSKELNVNTDSVDTLWYTLNYNIVNISNEEIEDIFKK